MCDSVVVLDQKMAEVGRGCLDDEKMVVKCFEMVVVDTDFGKKRGKVGL